MFADITDCVSGNCVFLHNNQRDDDNQKQTDGHNQKQTDVCCLSNPGRNSKGFTLFPEKQQLICRILWKVMLFLVQLSCIAPLSFSTHSGQGQRHEDVEVVIDLILQRWPFATL